MAPSPSAPRDGPWLDVGTWHDSLGAALQAARGALASDELGRDFLAADARDRGTVGVQIALTSGYETGLRPTQVSSLVPGSWAHAAQEIEEGDDIVRVDGNVVDAANVVQSVRGEGMIGSRCVLTVRGRNGMLRDVELVRSSMLRLQSMELLCSHLSQHEELVQSAEVPPSLQSALRDSCLQVSELLMSMEKRMIASQAAAHDRMANLKARVHVNLSLAEEAAHQVSLQDQTQDLGHDLSALQSELVAMREKYTAATRDRDDLAEQLRSVRSRQIAEDEHGMKPRDLEQQQQPMLSGLRAEDLSNLADAITKPTPLAQDHVLGLLQILRGKESPSLTRLRQYSSCGDYSSIHDFLSDLDSEMQQLRAELQIQLANISRIDIDSRRQELESLRETNAGLLQEVASLRVENEEQKLMLRRSTSLLQDKDGDMEMLSIKLEQSQEEREKYRRLVSSFSPQAKLVTASQHQDESSVKLQMALEERDIRISQLQNRLETAQATASAMAHLKDDVDKYKQVATDHEATIADLQHRLETSERTISNLGSNVEISTHEQAIEERERTIDYLKECLQTAQKKDSEMANTISERDDIIAELHLRLETAEAAALLTVHESEGKFADVFAKRDSKISELQIRLEAAEAAALQQAAANAAVHAQVVEERMVCSGKSGHPEKQDLAENTNSSTRSSEGACANDQIQLKWQQEHSESLQRQIEKLQQERSKLQQSILDNAKNRVPVKDLEASRTEARRLNERMKELLHENAAHDMKIRDLHAQLESRRSQLEDMRSNHEALVAENTILVTAWDRMKKIGLDDDVLLARIQKALNGPPEMNMHQVCSFIETMRLSPYLILEDLNMLLFKMSGEKGAGEVQIPNLTSFLSLLEAPHARSLAEVSDIVDIMNQAPAMASHDLAKLRQTLSDNMQDVDTLHLALNALGNNEISSICRICPIPSDHDEVQELRKLVNDLRMEKISGQIPLPPTIEPSSGKFRDVIRVLLVSGTPGSIIYYSTDGSVPNVKTYTGSGSSPVYLTLYSTCQVRAVCVNREGMSSGVCIADFQAEDSDAAIGFEASKTHQQSQSRLCGIGVLFGPNDDNNSIIVKRIVPGGPGFKDGRIRPGQTLVRVDENDVETASIEKVMDMIIGPAHTDVTLRLRQKRIEGADEKDIEFSANVTREPIESARQQRCPDAMQAAGPGDPK